MIHLFFSRKKTTYAQMKERNGDVILKHCVSAKAVFERNSVWYVEIEFPKSDLMGMEISDESVFKVDINFEEPQLYRLVYPKYKKQSDTYTCYATHVFFDSQKEVFVFDDRTMSGTWEDAIHTANDIITNSRPNYPYKIYGHGEYVDYANINAEDEKIVYFRNVQNSGYCLDVPSASEDASVQLQTYQRNRTSAQTFMLKKVGSDRYGYIYGILSLCSCRWLKLDSEKVVLGSLYDDPPDSSEKWWFINNGSSYEISPYMNIYYGIYPSSTSIDNGSSVIVADRGTAEVGNACKWMIEDVDSTQTAYWVRYNLIQCLFGTEDNSMINRWPECESNRFVAMFNNYDCYFGNSDYYASYLKPNDFFISNKEMSEYTKKKSMENVVTGIIPKAYNGRILPNNEIVKASNWYTDEIHRIDVKEYSDIKLKEDDSEAKKTTLGVFANETNLRSYLRIQAKKSLEKELQKPKTETSIKFEELFSSNVPDAQAMKLNDLIYVETEFGKRERFYLNKLTYNLITELPEDLDLVLESEV